MPQYIALIHKDEDSDYGVSFVDFPGCITAGDSLDAAYKCAIEALSGHMEVMAKNGQDIPAPSNMETLTKDNDFSDALMVMAIPAFAKIDKVVRRNISGSAIALDAIESHAKARGASLSSFLLEAAREKISG